jgi:trimeric autotransporter adhesin
LLAILLHLRPKAAIQTAQDGVDLNLATIATKQNQLSVSNRLNAAYIGDGSITTPELATLQGVTTTTTIQSQINAINNTLSNLDIDINTLEQLQNMDLTQFSTVGAEIVALQGVDTAHDAAILQNTTDIGNLQSNTADNTGRLNVYDSLTLDTRITTNATNLDSVTSDVSTIQTTLSGVQSTLDTKQDVIDTTHKLASTLVATNVSASASTLDVILQSLTDINTSQSTTLTDLNSSVISLQSQIDMNDGELLALQNADVAHDSQIATIQGDVSTLQTGLATKQAIINSGNKLNASVVHDSVRNMTQEALNSDLYTQVSGKQNTINVLNKLPIANVDLTGSVLENMDYTSSLATKLTSLDNQLSTLTTLQNGDIANFTAIDDNFTSIDTDIAALQSATQ